MATLSLFKRNRQKGIRLNLLALLWLLSLCWAACTPAFSSEVAENTPAPEAEPTIQAQAQEPTASATPTFPPAPTPTATPSATATVTPTATPLGCWRQGGRIELDQLRTELLPLPLEFRVYLPPCYDQQPDRRYPVIYLIHGSTYTDSQWIDLGAAEVADELIADREAPPFLMVMGRDRVWTSPKEDKFGQALVDVLLPWIDENYRTLPKRSHRAIGGISRGGGWAVHLGLSRWELFGAIGAHSLAVFNEDTPYYINKWLDEIPSDAYPRLYLDIGDRDRQEIRRSAEWFEGVLTKKGIPHRWHLYSGYHDDAYWQAHVAEYLRWYVEDW